MTETRKHSRNPFFENCPDRRHNAESNKWHRIPEGYLPLSIADMDCMSPLEVRDALSRRVEHNVFGYGRPLPELHALICDHMGKKYNWQISEDSIRWSAGVIMGFNQVLDGLAESDDGIVLQTPNYPPILETPGFRHLPMTSSPLMKDASGRYEIDFDLFEKSITPRTKFFLFSNPQNPTGRVFTREELEKIAEICLRHHLRILSDEIHQDMIFSGHHHIPIASLDKEVENITATFTAASKTYNIAGLKCSYAVIPNPVLRGAFDRGGAGLVDSLNVLGLTALDAAYRYGDRWLADVMTYLEENRDYVADEVASIDGMSMYKPEGTYLAWINCEGLNLDCSPYRFFYDNAHIVFNEGSTFGDGCGNYIRMNFGTSFERLQKAFADMRAALDKRNTSGDCCPSRTPKGLL